jgi:hypothetical protein
MRQLSVSIKVKVKGKEWDSGVGRDDTYGSVWKKEGTAERSAESAAAERLLD